MSEKWKGTPADRLSRISKALPRQPEGTASSPLAPSIDVAHQVRKRILAQVRSSPADYVAINTLEQQELEQEHLILSRAEIEESREIAERDFWFFLTRVLFPDTWHLHYVEDFHKPICDRLQGMLGTPGANQGFVLPREHRKTYLVMAWALWIISCVDFNIRILWIGAKESTSKKWATMIRDAFFRENSEFSRFHEVFPDFVMERTGRSLMQAAQFKHERRDKILADPTVAATYLSVTGAGGRADIEIFDDPYERRNVANPTLSAKALRDTMDLFPLIETSSAAKYKLRVFNMTRWAHHDPTGVLMGEKTDDIEQSVAEDIAVALEDESPFEFMVRHAFEDPNRLCEQCPPHVLAAHPHGHPDVEKGEAILDPVITRKALMHRLSEYALDKNRGESLWYHQYQNVCLAPSDQKFQQFWFISSPVATLPAAKLRVLCIDSADKDFQNQGAGDYMVALAGEFDDWGRLLLPHAERSNRWTRDEFIRRILIWMEATGWWPHRIGKEKFSNDTFLSDFRRALAEKGRTAQMIPVPRTVGSAGTFLRKWDWIVESLQAPAERGEILFGSNFPPHIRAAAVNELVNLGQTRYDDIADTLSLFYSPQVRPKFARPSGLEDQILPSVPLDLYGSTPTQQNMEIAVDDGYMRSAGMRRFAEEFGQVSHSEGARPETLDAKIDF